MQCHIKLTWESMLLYTVLLVLCCSIDLKVYVNKCVYVQESWVTLVSHIEFCQCLLSGFNQQRQHAGSTKMWTTCIGFRSLHISASYIIGHMIFPPKVDVKEVAHAYRN
jgi:hypothetical protein